MDARDIINLFGGQSALAVILGKSQSTVSYWAKAGMVPAKWQSRLLELAIERELPLTAADFIASNEKNVATKNINENKTLVLKMPQKVASQQYIAKGKFKNYLETKVKQKQMPVSFAQLAIAAYSK